MIAELQSRQAQTNIELQNKKGTIRDYQVKMTVLQAENSSLLQEKASFLEEKSEIVRRNGELCLKQVARCCCVCSVAVVFVVDLCILFSHFKMCV